MVEQLYALQQGLTDGWVSAIAVDAAGRVWIGHTGSGVDVLLADGITWKHYAGSVLSSSAVTDITAAPNGDVWPATDHSIRQRRP